MSGKQTRRKALAVHAVTVPLEDLGVAHDLPQVREYLDGPSLLREAKRGDMLVLDFCADGMQRSFAAQVLKHSERSGKGNSGFLVVATFPPNEAPKRDRLAFKPQVRGYLYGQVTDIFDNKGRPVRVRPPSEREKASLLLLKSKALSRVNKVATPNNETQQRPQRTGRPRAATLVSKTG